MKCFSSTTNRKVAHCLCILSIFFVSSCSSQYGHSDETKKLLVSIYDHPEFHALKKTLNLVIQDKLPNQIGTHHFYIARYPEDSTSTYLFWKEGRLVWPIYLLGNREEKWSTVRYPTYRDVIDLDQGVVESEEEIGSSTYLVTTDLVAERIYQTVVDGDLVEIDFNKVSNK